jgi:hypothetical protein
VSDVSENIFNTITEGITPQLAENTSCNVELFHINKSEGIPGARNRTVASFKYWI